MQGLTVLHTPPMCVHVCADGLGGGGGDRDLH